jgi:hypothetical protein
MAFRALVCSQKSETNAAMAAACKGAGIRAEVCADIFSAIEKGKTQAYSCVIVDWADQPEASFLLRRARESVANRNTVVVAIVDREPTAAEVRDNRLDFLINRPIAAEAARAVLAKASEKDATVERGGTMRIRRREPIPPQRRTQLLPPEPEHSHRQMFPEEDAAPESGGDVAADGNTGENDESKDRPRSYSFARVARGVLAAIVILAAVFCLWRSHETIEYLSRTREGRLQVLREAVAAFFYWNNGAASPVGAAGNDARQGRIFQPEVPQVPRYGHPALGVVATESNLPEARMPLPKAPDLPLPVAALERQEPALTIRRERAAIPESMRSSPPIAPPVVVTVNAAQMMPVSRTAASAALRRSIQRTRGAKRGISQGSARPYSEPCVSGRRASPEVAWSRGAADGDWTRRQRRGSEDCPGETLFSSRLRSRRSSSGDSSPTPSTAMRQLRKP